ncbi:MAG: phage tail tape measure protein [Thiobacillaceae bacterium]|nr:phage tail tape measure protein [Thiobacillaceae bacterium]
MPASKLNVQVIVGLVDRLTKPLQGLSGNIKRTAADMDRLLSKTANATFIGQAMADAGRGLFDPLRQAVHTAAELTGELTDVGIVANQAAAEIVAIRPELRALALEKVQPLRALTESLGAMTAKGLEWQTARSALPEVARAATAARAELKDMEGVAASLIQQLGIAPDRLADPYNRLAAAANAGGFELRDMAQYFPEVTASMAKVDTGTRAVSTLGAALQIVRKGAGSAGQAATQMGDLLEKMFAPATVDALEKKFNTDLPAALKRWRPRGPDVAPAQLAGSGEDPRRGRRRPRPGLDRSDVRPPDGRRSNPAHPSARHRGGQPERPHRHRPVTGPHAAHRAPRCPGGQGRRLDR